MKFREKWKREI